MCSLNWRYINNKIGLVFNRDESVMRAQAIPPQRFTKNGTSYLMPIDPEGKGSWLAVNSHGFIFCLLNDYQGHTAKTDGKLISRGQLIRQLAECRTIENIQTCIDNWPLDRSQPFKLCILSIKWQRLFHFDGASLSVHEACPEQLYSSAHPDADNISRLRAEFVSSQSIASMRELAALHQMHQPAPNNDRTYSLCMHRVEARSQSMTLIELGEQEAIMSYWSGQPCQADLDKSIKKGLTIATEAFV